MPEYVTTFAMREGRAPHFSRQLAWLRDTAALSPQKLTEVRATLQELGADDVRPVIRADQGAVSVSIRSLPALPESHVLDAEPILDRRTHPVFTGPDLGWQNRQLAQLAKRGAVEGLLVDDSGAVMSAVRSTLMVVRPGEVLVPAHPRTPQSVTGTAVVDLLAELGVTVTPRPDGLRISELRTHETWTVGSVIGVRRVTGWREYGSVLTAPSLPEDQRGGVPTAEDVEAHRWAHAEEI